MLINVLKECWQNRDQISRIAQIQLKIQYSSTKLKLFWTFLNPAIQVLIYWLVFNIGMQVRSAVEGVPYIAWMYTGLAPWLFISSALVSGAGSIVAMRSVVMNMKYPLSTIPVASVSTEVSAHLLNMVVLVIVQLICGVRYDWNIFGLVYFIFCAWCFLVSYSLLFSALNVIVRDTQRTIQAILRLLFYLTPIAWMPQENTIMADIMRWNPFFYIIEGYRGSMLMAGSYNLTLTQHVYFWLLTFVMFISGCIVHMTLRPKFADYL